VFDVTTAGVAVTLSGGEQVSESCVRSQSLSGAALSMVQMINVRTSPERVIEVMSALTHGQQEKLSIEDIQLSSLSKVEKNLKPTTRVLEKDSVVSSEDTTDTRGPCTDELAITLSATELKKIELATSLIEGMPVQRTRLVALLKSHVILRKEILRLFFYSFHISFTVFFTISVSILKIN